MRIVLDYGRLVEAARAAVAVDQAGELPILGDNINSLRREFRQRESSRTIGENVYIDGLANLLHKTTGIDHADCWSAVSEAVRPSWLSMALAEIIDFAAARRLS